jgi:hypothetical protein
MQVAQEAATRSAIERHKLDVTQVQAWCKSGLHTGVADTIDWAADFAQRHCDGDPGVTIRLGFSELVRHMSPADLARLEGRGATIGAFGKGAMGSGSFWVAARDSKKPEWDRLVLRAEDIEGFGPGAMGSDAFWSAARDSDDPKWGVVVLRAKEIELVEEHALKCRDAWQLICSATPDDWGPALTRITLVHQEAPEGVRANGFWLLLLKKLDDAQFATAMDRAKKIKQSKHSDGTSSALTSDSCWDQLGKMHDDRTWGTMFAVFLSFAKGAANQDLLWAVLDRNFTVAVSDELQDRMKEAVVANKSNNKPKPEGGRYPPSRAVLEAFLKTHDARHAIWRAPVQH